MSVPWQRALPVLQFLAGHWGAINEGEGGSLDFERKALQLRVAYERRAMAVQIPETQRFVLLDTPEDVARALDAEPSRLTALMMGIGKVATEAVPQLQHRVCCQQFLTYLAYRDDVDLATGLHRDGYTDSAWIVLGGPVSGAEALQAKAREAEVATAMTTDMASGPGGWMEQLKRRAEDLAGCPLTYPRYATGATAWTARGCMDFRRLVNLSRKGSANRLGNGGRLYKGLADREHRTNKSRGDSTSGTLPRRTGGNGDAAEMQQQLYAEVNARTALFPPRLNVKRALIRPSEGSKSVATVAEAATAAAAVAPTTPAMILYFGNDSAEMSPLTILRRDDSMWGGARAVATVRKMEDRVGLAAAKLVNEYEETERPPILMSDKIGAALLGRSNSLGNARRRMAAGLALQATVMGIMNVSRQHVRRNGTRRLGLESHERLDTIQRDFWRATGTNLTPSLIDALPLRTRRYTLKMFLAGVPWLHKTQKPRVVYAWTQPEPVAKALDTDRMHPTGWMAGMDGRCRRRGVDGGREECLQGTLSVPVVPYGPSIVHVLPCLSGRHGSGDGLA